MIVVVDIMLSVAMIIYRGKNAVNQFLQTMLQEVKYCRNILKNKFNKLLNMTVTMNNIFKMQQHVTCRISSNNSRPSINRLPRKIASI